MGYGSSEGYVEYFYHSDNGYHKNASMNPQNLSWNNVKSGLLRTLAGTIIGLNKISWQRTNLPRVDDWGFKFAGENYFVIEDYFTDYTFGSAKDALDIEDIKKQTIGSFLDYIKDRSQAMPNWNYFAFNLARSASLANQVLAQYEYQDVGKTVDGVYRPTHARRGFIAYPDTADTMAKFVDWLTNTKNGVLYRLRGVLTENNGREFLTARTTDYITETDDLFVLAFTIRLYNPGSNDEGDIKIRFEQKK